MNIWKRAMLYLIRKKGRSILLFFILFFMGTCALVGLVIKNSASKAAADIRENLGSSFNVSLKPMPQNPEDTDIYEYTTDENGNSITKYKGPIFTQQYADEIATIPGITKYNAEYLTIAQLDHITLVPGSWADSVEIALSDPNYEPAFSLEEMENSMRQTYIIGNTDSELFEKFRTGAFELAEGRHIHSDDQGMVMISERIAEMNHLQVGDTITASYTQNMLNGGDIDKILAGPFNLEIIGIFAVNGYQPVNEYTAEFDIVENWILTDLKTVELFDDFEYNGAKQSISLEKATYFVKDPSALNSIMQSVKEEKNLDEKYFDISLDDTVYKESVKPLDTMSTLTWTLVILLLCGSALVLALVFTMWIKSRKKEMGIYLSMGVRKHAILGQLLVECLVIGIIAFGLSYVTSNTVSNRAGNALLAAVVPKQEASQEVSQQELTEAIKNGTSSELSELQTPSNTPETLLFTIDFVQFAFVLLLGFAITFLAVIRASYQILKMKPKQILS